MEEQIRAPGTRKYSGESSGRAPSVVQGASSYGMASVCLALLIYLVVLIDIVATYLVLEMLYFSIYYIA